MSDLSEATLAEKFALARWTYGIGRPIISDAEYTLLYNAYAERFPNSPYLRRSWSSDPCPTQVLEKFNMSDYAKKFEMLDKTESIPSLNSFVEIQSRYKDFSGCGTVSMKHDGWNIQAEYNSGRVQSIHTRGRKAATVSEYDNLRKLIPETIKYPGPVRVVMEATVSNANYPFCKSMWGSVNNRVAVVSVLTNPGYEHLLDLHAFAIHGVDLNGRCKFEVLEGMGFNVPKWTYVHDYSEILEAIDSFSGAKPYYNSPTDGLVMDDGNSLNAFRVSAWEEPIYKSYVRGYVEEYSSHRIVPKIVLRPILRDGVTQRVLPITNWKRIITYNLQIGYPIAFRVVSGAIADFDAESTRLLHETWKGKFEYYREIIDAEERFKHYQSL